MGVQYEMNRTDTMIVVDKVREPAERGAYPASALLGEGRIIGTPQRATFAGDRRMMEDIRTLLATQTDPEVVIVQDWQIVGGHN